MATASRDAERPDGADTYDGLGAIGGTAAAVAAATVIRTDAVAAATDAATVAEPAAVAESAAVRVGQDAVDAATRTAGAARAARVARAAAARWAAALVADAAEQTVHAVQAQADALAAAVASTAAAAAQALSHSVLPDDLEAAREVVRVRAAVITAATIKAQETAQAAVLVAGAVAASAAAVAATTAADAAAMEHEVSDAAAAVRAVTAAAADRLAGETVDRATAVATATRVAAVASERLLEANRQLQRAGRHDRSVAVALQTALLSHLPEPPDLQLAARYLTAAEQDQVGGDWYDALVMPNGSTTLVIGDVIGHDIVAASVMGQLRNVLRALLWDRAEQPSAGLTRLDRANRDLHIDALATLIVANIELPRQGDPSRHRTMRWTNAGHPAPVLIHADGSAQLIAEHTDILLGVAPETTREDHTLVLSAGATLLLYTDGLVETPTRDFSAGQQQLLDAARRHHAQQPGELIDAIIRDVVIGHPTDDVAVLAVRLSPE